MPLTHVCMWAGHGWKRVTAEEAARIHPGGTVSARSGLFMCELCGQYVSLTDGTVRDRYFKHSRYETSKDCPERTFGSNVTFYFSNTEKHLPLRLKILSSIRIQFEIGFLSLPANVLSRLSKYQLSITPQNNGYDSEFRYSFSRLNRDSITYLNVGAFPAKEYSISSNGERALLSEIWPQTVVGINGKAVFDKENGKMIPVDGDVRVNHSYYVISETYLFDFYENVSVKEVCKISKNWKTWRVYEVKALKFDEEPAKFFLDLHCRLSEYPVDLTPIWPPVVETPYLILHKDDILHYYLQGDAVPKVFPYSSITKQQLNNGYYFSFNSNERQQVLSAGRTQVLSYCYLWKSSLDYIGKKPRVSVTNIRGEQLSEGVMNILPEKSTIVFNSDFDGVLVVKEEEQISEQIELSAGRLLTYDNCKFNSAIEVFQGLDSIWKIMFLRPEKEKKDEKLILSKLNSFKDNKIEMPHRLGGLAIKIKGYPQLKAWLYKQVRIGYISKDALRLLQDFIEERNGK